MSVIYITDVQDSRTLDSSPPAFAAVTILLNLQPRRDPLLGASLVSKSVRARLKLRQH